LPTFGEVPPYDNISGEFASYSECCNGYYDVPSGLGWGVEVDESVIAGHPEDPNAKMNMFDLGWEAVMCRQSHRRYRHE
jgi:hypothetical protein